MFTLQRLIRFLFSSDSSWIDEDQINVKKHPHEIQFSPRRIQTASRGCFRSDSDPIFRYWTSVWIAAAVASRRQREPWQFGSVFRCDGGVSNRETFV